MFEEQTEALGSAANSWTSSPGVHVQIDVHGSKAKEIYIKVGGLLFSLILPTLVLSILLESRGESSNLSGVDSSASSRSLWVHGLEALLFGTISAAAGAILSDLPSGPLLFSFLPPVGVFCCGNWGCIVPRDRLGEDYRLTSNELFPKVCVRLLSNILDVVELRGAQAGGCNTFLSDGAGNVVAARSRTVKSKRGHLAQPFLKVTA